MDRYYYYFFQDALTMKCILDDSRLEKGQLPGRPQLRRIQAAPRGTGRGRICDSRRALPGASLHRHRVRGLAGSSLIV